MTEFTPLFEVIDKDFNFKEYEFRSGIQELDDFFYKYSSNFIKYGYSQMYVLREDVNPNIIGYFTLASSTIQWDESLFIEKIARYVPGILLGMFAIDNRFRRKQFGSDLIKKAVSIALRISQEIGCRCIFVDSLIKRETINFYLKLGFEFVDKPLAKTILKKMEKKEKIERSTIKMYFDLFRIKK